MRTKRHSHFIRDILRDDLFIPVMLLSLIVIAGAMGAIVGMLVK